MSERKDTRRSTKGADTTAKGFTDDERAAMKERAQELKAEARRGQGQGGRETRPAREDRRDAGTGSRHGRAGPAIVTANAPDLMPKTWYGMPAYAKDGKVVCFFQSAEKFKSRYATLGFNDAANLDEGAMWPTSFALKELTAADEKRIGALVKKAVS